MKKIPAELVNEVATVAKDHTFPAFGGVMQQRDATLITRGGGKGLQIYDDIERDCHAFAVLQKRKLAVIGKEWRVDPATTSRMDKKAADLVTAQLAALTGDIPDDAILPQAIGFDAVCLNLLDSLLKGFAVGEIMWRSDGKEVYAAEVRARDQRRFEFMPVNGGYQLALKSIDNLFPGVPVPARKFIVQTFGAKAGEPHGLGLGTRLFWPVFFKRQDISFWLTFVDKFAMPTAIGTYPAGTDDAGKTKLLNALGAIASEAGIAIPEGMMITLLEAARSGSVDCYEKLARYMDEQISEAVLGETGSTNQSGDGGSRARDEVGNESRLEIVKADADLQCAVLNATLVRWITLLNLPTATPPRVWRDCSEPEDLKSRADRDKVIFDMGFKPSLQYIQDTYGGEWVENPSPALPLTGEGANLPPVKGGLRGVGGISFAAGEDAHPVDAFVNSFSNDELGGLMKELLKPALTKLKQTGDYAEAMASLAGLYPEMDTARLTDMLARMMFVADLAGRADAQS